MGKCPSCLPPGEWDVLWLTPIGAVGSLCPFRRITQALRNGRAQDRSETLTRGVGHERPRTAAGNCRLLPAHRACGIDLRPACRQRRQARRAAAQRRPDHDRDARPHPRLHGQQPHGRERRASRDHRAAGASAGGSGFVAAGRCRGARSAAQLPLLRQPAEIPAVRQHLQRKVGGGQPGRARARQHPPAPAGAAGVRRRRRRRHRAAPGDARDARPLSAHAVLRRRQGDQPRGRPPHHAEDVGPLLRASGDRAGADQSRLRRRAVAGGQVALRRLEHGLARGAAGRQFRLPLRAADHRSGAVPVAELEGRRQRQDRQSGLRAAGRAGALSRGPQVPARPDHPAAGRHGRQLRPGDRLAALPRARVARLQGQARDRAARASRSGRAAG